MAKTWHFVYYYVDILTGEYLTKQQVEKEYNKKHYKTEYEYRGKYNIKKITYSCRKCDEQLNLW